MTPEHPLERPVWSALATRQSALAVAQGGARRFAPDFGMFAAVDDAGPETLEALGALVRGHGDVAIVEPEPPPAVPATSVVSVARCWQMVAGRPLTPPEPPFEILPLTDADGPEMLALATLTRPGPFFRRTHQLGEFIGVKQHGRLIAMAGERMRPLGHTEVSGVCTHPEHRGRGYGGALLGLVVARIQARGETPFLHVYADNKGAIALYEQLGFSFSRELVMTVLTAG
jgi:predicted GNAT family acetyltransferase